MLVLSSSCTVTRNVTDTEETETANEVVESTASESDDQPAASDQGSASVESVADKIDVDVTNDEEFNSVLLPKFMGISVFEQANEGAIKASRSLRQPPPIFVGPASANDTQMQIDLLNEAVTFGYDAVLISNNAGDAIAAAAEAALEAGVTIITWDSPIPSATGEKCFCSPS